MRLQWGHVRPNDALLNGETPQVNMYMEKMIQASIWYYTQRAVMIV